MKAICHLSRYVFIYILCGNIINSLKKWHGVHVFVKCLYLFSQRDVWMFQLSRKLLKLVAN